MSRPIFPKQTSNDNNMRETSTMNKVTAPSNKMSFEELHRRLQVRLKNQGVINDIRAELRSKLMHELYEIADPIQPGDIPSDTEESQLPLQISNWLVCNHFQRGNFEFTLSTFLRESGIVTLPEYNMTFHDVLYIFGIHPNTDFYKSICEKYKEDKLSGGLLFFIIQNLLMCILPQTMKNYTESSTETENIILNEDKLQRKLLHEIEYVRQKLDDGINTALETKDKNDRSKFLCVSCQTETQLTAPTNLEQAKREIECLKKSLYVAQEDLKMQAQKCEKVFLDKTHEMETRYVSQIREQDQKFRQEKSQQEMKSIEAENSTVGIINLSLEKAQLQVKELESHIELYKKQNDIAQKQNKSYQLMIESMSDYEILKFDLAVTKRELELSMSRYQEAKHQWLTAKDELEKKVVQLTLQITSPCLELLSANQEVQKVMEKSQLEQSSWSQERNYWQKELQKTKLDHHTECLRVQEQKEHINNLHEVIHKLQLQLEHSQLSKSEQGHQMFSTGRHTTVNTNLNYLPHNTQSILSKCSDQNFRDLGSLSPSPSSRSDYIKEAKLRIDQLQAEADSLDKKYGQCLKNQQFLSSPCQSFKTFYSNLGSQNIYDIPSAHYLNNPYSQKHLVLQSSPYASFSDKFIFRPTQDVENSNSKYGQTVSDKPVSTSIPYNQYLNMIPSKNVIPNSNYSSNLPNTDNNLPTLGPGEVIVKSESQTRSNTYAANNLSTHVRQNVDNTLTESQPQNNANKEKHTPNSCKQDAVAWEELTKQSNEKSISDCHETSPVDEYHSSEILTSRNMVFLRSKVDSTEEASQSLAELANNVGQNAKINLEISEVKDYTSVIKAVNLDQAWKQLTGNATVNPNTFLKSEAYCELSAETEYKQSDFSIYPNSVFSERITSVPKTEPSKTDTETLVQLGKNKVKNLPENFVNDTTVEDCVSNNENFKSIKDTQLSPGTQSNAKSQFTDLVKSKTEQQSTPIHVPDHSISEQSDLVEDPNNDSDINLSIGDQALKTDNSNSESMW